MTKVCAACGIQKDVSEYSKHDKDGSLNSRCKPCRARAAREYRASNSEAVRKRDRARNARRKPYRDAYNHRYYHQNRERCDQYNREYRRRHWNEWLRAMATDQARRWRHANPDKVAAKDARRNAREKTSVGSFTREEFVALCERFGNRCVCCGVQDAMLVPDHIVPLAKGGCSYIENIQPLCRSCNCKKHVKVIDYRADASRAA